MSPSLKGKHVLILQQRGWGLNVGNFLAQKLAAEGCTLSAITYKKSADLFHRMQTDVRYEQLVNHEDILERPDNYLKGRKFSLDEITRDLDIDSVWPLVAGSRDLTRSYDERFYYRGRQAISDEYIVTYLQAVYACLHDIFEAHRPDVVVAPMVADVSQRFLYHFALQRGVQCVCITDSKVRGIWLAANTPWEDAYAFNDRLDALNAGAASANAEKARLYIAESRNVIKRPVYMEKFYKKQTVAKRLRSELAPLRRIYEWCTEPHLDRIALLGDTLDYRSPRTIVRDHYMKRWFAYCATHFPYADASSLEKYVYYPLQVEPEVTIDVFAPLYRNQAELARVIALSLPGEYTLVVKDHPAMLGYRSPEFLRDVAGTLNVRLVDYRTPGDALLRGASLVIAPNSTSLAEAALLNKPGIQFGNQGLTQKLPNVVRHTDFSTLSSCIQTMLATPMSGPAYEKKLEHFIAAAYDVGSEMDYMSAWEDGKSQAREAIWRLYSHEIRRICG